VRVHRGKALLAGVAAIALALTACSSSGGGGGESDLKAGTLGTGAFTDCATNQLECNSGDTKPGGDVTYTMEKTVVGWNINYTTSNVFDVAEALDGIMPSAYYGAPDLKPALNTDMMDSATSETQNGKQVITYKIKQNAEWSDGVPINFDDWQYAWQTQNGTDCPKCGAASTSGYDQIEGMESQDNGKTVVVTMKSTFADWQIMFGPLLPAHIAKDHGDDGSATGLNDSFQWFDKNYPTWSGGPYMITDYKKDLSIVEKPNPKWYGATQPSLDTLSFHIITSQDQEPDALQNNEVQAIYPQPNKDLVDKVNAIGGDIQTYIGKGLVWEHFNLNEKNEFLADKALRQAIFTAIDRKEIIARTYGEFVPNMEPIGNHIYVPGQPGYQDNTTETGQGSGDIDKATQILKDAGYTGIGSALKTKDGKAVASMRCTYSEGNPYRQSECQIVQNTLKKLGMNITLKTTPDLGELGTGDFDIIVFAWVGAPFVVAGANQLYTAKGGTNFAYTYNSDPPAEALIKQALGVTDQAKVQDLMNQADKLLQQDAFELPLYQKPTFLAAYNDIVNLRDNATSTGPPYNVQEWGIKAS
jgi:peptide/nickel transport system substrate-binding protein